MSHTKYRWARLVLVCGLLATLAPARPALAQLNSCSTNITPHTVSPGSDDSFNFGLYNNNSTPDPIVWIRLTRPAGAPVTIESGSASGWQADATANSVTFTQGSLPYQYSQSFSAQALASNNAGGPYDWKLEVSDDPNGAGSITCGGDLSLAIANQQSVINISNVRVSNVTPTHVTILWDTDVASTSQVNYGTGTGYGSSSGLDSSLVLAHSVTLTGLSQNTAYHFDVLSATPADGGATDSGDNTFLTAVQEALPVSPVGGSSGGGASGANVPGATVKAVPTESIPPTVALTTDLSKPFIQTPAISGTASDNDAVARVEYSVDGGKNWLPVDQISMAGKGRKATPAHVTFSFTPVITEDGNYPVVVRATDTSGNQARTSPATLVIDRLPPQVGPSLVADGPNVITPQAGSGIFTSLAGVDQKITLSAIGGPISVILKTKSLLGTSLGQTFSLTRSQNTGLWSGTLSLQHAGAFTIDAEAVDGAGNQTKRTIATVHVFDAPKLTQKGSGAFVAIAKVSVYAQDPETNSWNLWDAGSYGQTNPQIVGGQHGYRFVLPPGRYYLSVDAVGYHPLFSKIFTVTKTTPLTTPLVLAHQPSFKLGRARLTWPFTPTDRANIGTTSLALATVPVAKAQVSAPRTFSLKSANGKTISSIDLTGKPTVITALATWHPATSEQLPALAALQANTDLNVVPVALQENAGRARVFAARAGLKLTLAVDPDGVLVDRFGVQSLPTHYFLDRTGVVRKVEVGVLTEKQLLTDLESL
jgi:peroxiredoxin